MVVTGDAIEQLCGTVWKAVCTTVADHISSTYVHYHTLRENTQQSLSSTLTASDTLSFGTSI